MAQLVLQYEPVIRLTLFFGIFLLVALWELAAPRRSLTTSKRDRWAANLLLVGLNTLLVRLLFPLSAVAFAALCQERGWGLLNQWPLHPVAVLVASAVALDFVIYLQHVMFHAVPVLWRLHMMHHADLDYDVTTGARFHPIEILLSMGIKFAAIMLLGASPAGVIVFEVLLNGTAMFNHGNIRLPLGVDRVLRWLVVTPDMHRVHHSVVASESNSNFGFNLPWWDRLLGTYQEQPAAGHVGMVIGLSQFRDPARLKLGGMLLLPFTGTPGGYAINRRWPRDGAPPAGTGGTP